MNSEAPFPLQAAVCVNCGRSEIRPTVRICPNCNAVLPGLTGVRTNSTRFADLARHLPPQEPPPTSTIREVSPESAYPHSQPWAIPKLREPVVRERTPDEDDLSGPFLTHSLWGDRALGFAGEVAAVALAVGTLIAVGEAADSPTMPDWSPALILIGGAALFTLGLWQAKRLRDIYPQLARGWYAGRSVWLNTFLSFLIGSVVVGLILLMLGPLGYVAAILGSVLVVVMGPVAWLLLALIVFLTGRMVLYAIRRRRR